MQILFSYCSSGNEYPAVVEFAPYQKVPIVARKVDHRENTLDDGKYAQQLDANLEKMHVHKISHVTDVYLATYIVKLYFLFLNTYFFILTPEHIRKL